MTVRVLLVDPDTALRRAWARALLEGRLDVLTAEDAASGRGLLAASPDVLLASAGAAADLLSELHPAPPVILLWDRADADPADAVSSLGAFAVVERAELPPLGLALLVAAARAPREQERPAGAEELEFVAVSEAARAAVRKALAAARSGAPLWVMGAGGAGKKTLARTVHARSGRRGALVELDATSLDRAGLERALAEMPADGTLVLSRVDALDAGAQEALARARKGGLSASRLVSTALPSLRDAKDSGAFSKELFFRLSPLVIDLPPLRARVDDVAVLAYLFVRRAAERFGVPPKRLSRDAVQALRAWTWPDNTHELEAVIVRALTSCPTEVITPGDLGLRTSEPRRHRAGLGAYAEERAAAIAAFERDYLKAVLEHTGGNVTQAAKVAGMDSANFRRVLRRVNKS